MSAPDKPTRIARIVTRLGVGGVERHVCSLSANLDHDKFRSWLICGRAGKTERECHEFAAEVGVEPIVIDQLRRKLGLWDVTASLMLYQLLARIQPHIVHTHQDKAGALGRSVARLRLRAQGPRPHLVHTFHGHRFQGYFSSPVTRAFIAIERVLARLTDLIITVTPTIRRQLIEQYRIASADKVRVVPLGFDFAWLNDIPRHRGWLRARLGARDSTVIFGTVGRLTGIKNTELLMRAFARLLRETRMDARLVVIGDGELLGALRSLADGLALGERAIFVSWVLDRAKIFCDLDVTCLSSYNEGSPACLIESLAAGVPVVATRVGGVADVVSSALDGELVESGNECAYTAALARVANRRSRISRERSVAVCENYSTSRLVRDIENIYSEILENDRLR